MSIAVKFACDEDFRRARIGSLTWEEVVGAASASFPELHQGSFDLKYHDDEDDLCLLSPVTFPDFASLNEQARNVRVELVKKPASAPSAPPQPESHPTDVGVETTMGTSAPSAGSQGCRHGGHFSGQPADSSRGFVQEVLGGLHRASTLAGGEAVAALFVHFVPQLLRHVQSAQADIDRVAAEKPECMRSLIQALREALEPFPQCQETQISLDRMLQAECLEGVGSATEAFLRSLIQLPFEQQRDIVSVAFEGMFEKLLQLVPEEAPQPAEAWAHCGVTCDGCGAMPILGPRFKCTECPDYDLCGSCYLQKDVLHPGHQFSCVPHSRGKGKGKGFGPCPLFAALAKGWGKDCGKGWKGWSKGSGKGCRKGWGKAWCKGRDSGSDSSDSSFSDGFDSSDSSKSRGSAANGKSVKQELRAAKHAWKKAKFEAKEKWKAAKKAWKKELKQERKAKKDRAKQERKAMKLQLRTPAAEQPKAQGPSLTFPVEVADGRRLTISWSIGEAPDQVAVRFAAQHGIAENELPEIANFVRQAEAAVAGEGTPEASSQPAQEAEVMDVSEPVPSAPPAEAAREEEHLQSLEAMGFTNRELNAQLLAANEGNLQAVLEKLL
mmetsp:Transcript_129839/g.315391  ORF Transcript_129839/g.315391 Transcript_129839/m.315391 type:complete len:609 (+) Transcript_129839:67-1893(+)